MAAADDDRVVGLAPRASSALCRLHGTYAVYSVAAAAARRRDRGRPRSASAGDGSCPPWECAGGRRRRAASRAAWRRVSGGVAARLGRRRVPAASGLGRRRVGSRPASRAGGRRVSGAAACRSAVSRSPRRAPTQRASGFGRRRVPAGAGFVPHVFIREADALTGRRGHPSSRGCHPATRSARGWSIGSARRSGSFRRPLEPPGYNAGIECRLGERVRISDGATSGAGDASHVRAGDGATSAGAEPRRGPATGHVGARDARRGAGPPSVAETIHAAYESCILERRRPVATRARQRRRHP